MCSSLCCVGVRTPEHVIANCSVTQTAAAKKLNWVQFQAPDKSALKLMTAAGRKVLLKMQRNATFSVQHQLWGELSPTLFVASL